MRAEKTYVAFAGPRLVAHGPLRRVLAALQAERGHGREPIVLEEQSGQQVDFDMRGTLDELLERSTPAERGAGRPRLGVLSREVTLLPTHWEWLGAQPNGASAALRRLVAAAIKAAGDDGETERASIDATYRMMSAVAGDLPAFEEAARALYTRNPSAFRTIVGSWPGGVRDYFLRRAPRS